jgi:hypothetical protein
MVLYHILNEDDCAEVRRFIVQNNLMEQVQFRNIDRSEEATKDLMALQGHLGVPFLVHQGKGSSGKKEILQVLQTLIS